MNELIGLAMAFMTATIVVKVCYDILRGKYQDEDNENDDFFSSQDKARIIDNNMRAEDVFNKIRESRQAKQALKSEVIWTKAFLKSLEWKRYEEVCMEYLRIKNCQANVTCIGADGGIDIKIADSAGTVFAIGQCKAWNRQIGVSLIRELYGVMAADKVKHGIFLTTSEYSKDALEFAKGKNLLLVDCDELVGLINGLNEIDKRRIDLIATAGDYTTPTCVRCNVKMIKRTARNGKNAGGNFWGCPNYPKCKNTMQVRQEAKS
ncbi:restriction endonuclease [Methylomonas rhizoryzae]|uniref:restriction endonuclease n=1 Tax=Methylomonas rhizoryzae TaxID=2608981 RepID=UPI001E5D4830|nr:restriction endonuclease [Methylomonas rhizoryzae]